MLAWIRTLLSRVAATLRPGTDDDDFERELRAHVDLMSDDLVTLRDVMRARGHWTG